MLSSASLISKVRQFLKSLQSCPNLDQFLPNPRSSLHSSSSAILPPLRFFRGFYCNLALILINFSRIQDRRRILPPLRFFHGFYFRVQEDGGTTNSGSSSFNPTPEELLGYACKPPEGIRRFVHDAEDIFALDPKTITTRHAPGNNLGHWYFFCRSNNRSKNITQVGGQWQQVLVGKKPVVQRFAGNGYCRPFRYITKDGVSTGWQLEEYGTVSKERGIDTSVICKIFWLPLRRPDQKVSTASFSPMLPSKRSAPILPCQLPEAKRPHILTSFQGAMLQQSQQRKEIRAVDRTSCMPKLLGSKRKAPATEPSLLTLMPDVKRSQVSPSSSVPRRPQSCPQARPKKTSVTLSKRAPLRCNIQTPLRRLDHRRADRPLATHHHVMPQSHPSRAVTRPSTSGTDPRKSHAADVSGATAMGDDLHEFACLLEKVIEDAESPSGARVIRDDLHEFACLLEKAIEAAESPSKATVLGHANLAEHFSPELMGSDSEEWCAKMPPDIWYAIPDNDDSPNIAEEIQNVFRGLDESMLGPQDIEGLSIPLKDYTNMLFF